MTGENTIHRDNFNEVVIPGDLQDLLKWTEVDQRIADTMKAIVTQYAAQVDAAVLDECSKVAVKFGIAVDEERLVQALTDAQKFYCEGYRAGKTAARAEIVRCKDCKYNGVLDLCPMCFEETVYQDEGNYPDGSECWDVYEQKVDRTVYDGFCDRGERRADE